MTLPAADGLVVMGEPKTSVSPGLSRLFSFRRISGFLGLLLALAIVAGFAEVVKSYFVPAIGVPGVDENAYLVGGRNVAEHGSPGMHPETPFAFVGPMWDLGRDGWFYPKYPFGTPLLDASAIWLTPGHDVRAAFAISPICAALSVAAIFLLGRMLAGPFWGLLGAILLASNSTLLQLALVPSSHAPDICFALWGMTALVAWVRGGKLWLGIIAGFLIGFAMTIRYTEGLLLLPLAIGVLLKIQWKIWRSWLKQSTAILAWSIPVGTLLIFNHITTGHWTGYDATNESTGFTLAEFQAKWQSTLQAMDIEGLSLLLPVGILGMLMMLGRNWRMGLILIAWFVPSVLLYMAYYWGEAGQGVSYLRFFLASYPPVIVAAMWLISKIADSWAARIGAGVFVAAVAMLGIYNTLPAMAQTQASNLGLAYSGAAMHDTIASSNLHHAISGKPIFFSDEQGGGMGSQLLLYLQFIGGGDWYTGSSFVADGEGRGRPGRFGGGGGPGRAGPGPGFGPGLGMGQGMAGQNGANNPSPMDPERQEYLQKVYANYSNYDLRIQEKNLISSALDQGRPVYGVLNVSTGYDFIELMESEGFSCKVLAKWQEPTVELPASPLSDGGGPPGGGRGMGRGGFGGGGPAGGQGGFAGGFGGGPGNFGGGQGGFQPGGFQRGGFQPGGFQQGGFQPGGFGGPPGGGGPGGFGAGGFANRGVPGDREIGGQRMEIVQVRKNLH
ncbi:MAG: glycosyltransferase family 39 protein [Tepidisphaeraceae bacterium]